MYGPEFKNQTIAFIKKIAPKPFLRWREAAYFRRFGELELDLVKPLSEADRDAIDVGANLGAYVHFMRRASQFVYAFEPIPWLAEQLAYKFASRVIVRNIALSDENGTAILRIPILDGKLECGLSSVDPGQQLAPGEHRDITVVTRRLDDTYKGNLGFMKIDVEGHEQAVLDGAVKTIDRCHPNLLVEIEERFAPGCVHRTRSFLETMGYSGYFVSNGALEGIDTFDPASMQRWADIAGFAPGMERTHFSAYVNNFIFIHRSRQGKTLPRLRAATETG